MKIIININSILIYSICISGILFLASSCSENKSADSRDVAEQENMAKLESDDNTIVVIKNDNNAKFLMDAAEMQLGKISLGKLAQQKDGAAHVQKLGKMMEEDHSKSYNELKALAQSKSISIPTSITTDSKDAYEKLNQLSGNDFGKAYSDLMVENHVDAIDLFEKVSTDSDDPDIRSWASKQLPALRTHLKHAEDCKKECAKM